MRTILAVILFAAGIGIAAFTLVHALIFVSQDEIPISQAAVITATELVPPEKYPARIHIQKIGVDTVVEHVGIVAGNRMAAPKKFSEAAWFKYGTVPGQKGSAVIAGHLNNGLGLDGAFRHLAELEIGDEVVVETKDGTSVRFKVDKMETYPLGEVPQSVFAGGDTAHLNLITCNGRWIQTPALGWTYTRRLVVFTSLVK